MWSTELDRWWYRWSEVPTKSVLDWAGLPESHDVADGTLWWVDTDLGEALAMLHTPDPRFVDLTGQPIEVEPRGDARLFHPLDGEELVTAELWRDRVEELGFPTEPQVLRPTFDVSWKGFLRLPVPEPPSFRHLGPRGWTRRRRRWTLEVAGLSIRLELAESRGLTPATVDIDVLAPDGPVPSNVLSRAVRSELLVDAIQLGAQPPDGARSAQ